MVDTLGKEIIDAYTEGTPVKEIYSYGVKVWERTAQDNVIFYTSSDEQVIQVPTGSQYWGANLLSNTYGSNGGVIIFDSPVTSIGEKTFYSRQELTSITIPSSVTSIGNTAFGWCTGLTSITIPSSVTSIGDDAFLMCTGFTSFTIPSSITSIGYGAFSYCTGLTSITIPSSVTSIGNQVFSHCRSLVSIIVDSNNTYYDSRNNCNAIIETSSNKLIQGCKTTVIPSSVTSIKSYAFSYCTGLTSITIPSSVTSIGTSTFTGCTGLKSVIVNAVTPPNITGCCVFQNTSSDLQIYVPSGSVNAYKTASGWSEYADRIVSQ